MHKRHRDAALDSAATISVSSGSVKGQSLTSASLFIWPFILLLGYLWASNRWRCHGGGEERKETEGRSEVVERGSEGSWRDRGKEEKVGEWGTEASLWWVRRTQFHKYLGTWFFNRFYRKLEKKNVFLNFISFVTCWSFPGELLIELELQHVTNVAVFFLLFSLVFMITQLNTKKG